VFGVTGNLFALLVTAGVISVGLDLMWVLHILVARHATDILVRENYEGLAHSLYDILDEFRRRGIVLHLAIDGDALPGKAATDAEQSLLHQ
jgi:hypothetical protein